MAVITIRENKKHLDTKAIKDHLNENFPTDACVCVFTSIYHEDFICLDQMGYQGTDQLYYAEDVEFLCQFPLSLLYDAEPNF